MLIKLILKRMKWLKAELYFEKNATSILQKLGLSHAELQSLQDAGIFKPVIFKHADNPFRSSG